MKGNGDVNKTAGEKGKKMSKLSEQEAQRLIAGKLSRYFGVSPQEASREQIYRAVVMSVRDIMA